MLQTFGDFSREHPEYSIMSNHKVLEIYMTVIFKLIKGSIASFGMTMEDVSKKAGIPMERLTIEVFTSSDPDKIFSTREILKVDRAVFNEELKLGKLSIIVVDILHNIFGMPEMLKAKQEDINNIIDISIDTVIKSFNLNLHDHIIKVLELRRKLTEIRDTVFNADKDKNKIVAESMPTTLTSSTKGLN